MAPPLPEGTNRWLDLIQNREPITISQALAILASVALTWIDANVFHFSEDPLYTWVAVYAASTIIGLIYARTRAYAPSTVANIRTAAYVSGFQTGKEHQP